MGNAVLHASSELETAEPRHDPQPSRKPSYATGERVDRLEQFQSLISMVRWVCLGVCALLLATSPGPHSRRDAVMFAVLALWTAVRTIRPIRNYGFELGTASSIIVELGVATAAVCATGYWSSPLSFLLLPGVLIGGFSDGGPLSVGYGTITSLFVTFVSIFHSGSLTAEQWRASGQWAVELMLVAFVAGLGHRVLLDTQRKHSAAVDGMAKLTAANSLLVSLHRLAQTLPASLDLKDVLATTIANAKELFRPDSITVLLTQDSSPDLLVAACQGIRLPAAIPSEQIPLAIELARRTNATTSLATFERPSEKALLPAAKSGIYVPLRARQSVIGFIAVEYFERGHDGDDQKDLVSKFAEPAAVGIDNARWFGRIRTVAADEERIRIARDLHDRVGQSLAYIGFELDRIVRSTDDPALTTQVKRLRQDVSGVVTEVRETLYDIRTDVTPDCGIVPTIEAFLERVQKRSGLEVSFTHEQDSQLTMRQEREFFHVAQEAIVNVERHAAATSVKVSWVCHDRYVLLEVTDDGKGFSENSGRADSYGIRGMYERATAVGAQIEILGKPGQGTLVRCRMERL